MIIYSVYFICVYLYIELNVFYVLLVVIINLIYSMIDNWLDM